VKLAVIIPTFNESDEFLTTAVNSVLSQLHFSSFCIVVVDGSKPKQISHSDQVLYIPLPKNCNDFGDTPRAVGSLYAAGLGVDAILYLDADNFYDVNHLTSLLETQSKTGAEVIVSGRKFVRIDGSYMAECLTCDGVNFADTNCLMFTRKAFGILHYWALMAPEYHAIDDRIMWFAIKKAGYKTAFTGLHTVNYRATYPGYYEDLGETPPPGVKRPDSNAIKAALFKWRSEGNPNLVVRWRYRNHQIQRKIS